MALKFLDDAGYNQGMVRDEAPWLLAPGQVYDALNLLFDRPGLARMRAGTTKLVTGAQTAFAASLGFAYSTDATVIEELYGMGTTGGIVSIHKLSGAATVLGAASAVVPGRPVGHFGFLVFPGGTGNVRSHTVVAGATTAVTFANTVVYQVASGSATITLTGVDVTTNVKVGAVVTYGDATHISYGRVVAVTGAKTFTVWPTPTWTNAACPIGSLSVAPFLDIGIGGTCGASFQNRLLVGNTSLDTAVTVSDHRFRYSLLPTEAYTPSGVSPVSGATFVDVSIWPPLNFVDIPGANPIVAMEPITDNELLILTATSVVILQGNLVSQFATTSPQITFQVYPLGVTEGCLSDLSVVRTPIGIMWAGAEGVFAYWPPIRRSPAKTGIRNLLEGKLLNYWLSLSNAPNFVIHGAAYFRNHYMVSGSSNGTTFSLLVCLNSNAWSRMSGAGTDIFNSARRPTSPAQTFALRWWDTTGAAPSMTNGQTLRIESIPGDYVAGTTVTDMDGTAIPFSLTTRALAGDLETQKIFQRGTARYQQSSTTAAVTVSARAGIDPGDTATVQVTLGLLSNTATLAVSAATFATPIVITCGSNHGLQTDDFVDVAGGLVLTNMNGRWRITVLSPTTFALNGSVGNNTYGGGATFKKVTESDLQMTDLIRNQAVSFTVSGSPNYFELHGFRVATFESAPVMSA